MNKDVMFNENSGLIWKAIKDMHLYATKDMELDDYYQIGSMGLLRAIDTYDTSKGTQFSTYAVKCIKNEIGQYFQSQERDKRKMNSVTTSYNVETNVGDNKVEIIDCVVDFSSTEPFNEVCRTTLGEALKVLTEAEYEFFRVRYMEAELTDDITNKRTYTINKLGLKGVGEFKSIDRKVRIKLAKALGVNYDPRDKFIEGNVDKVLR